MKKKKILRFQEWFYPRIAAAIAIMTALAVISLVPLNYVTDRRLFALLFAAIFIICAIVVTFFILKLMHKSVFNPIRRINAEIMAIDHKDAGYDVAPHVMTVEMTELEENVKRISQSQRTYENFLASFSHEFKTPLNTIIGFTAMLVKPEVSDEDKAEYYEIITGEAKRMVSLTNSLLFLSQLYNGQYENERKHFNLDETIRIAIVQVMDGIQQKHLQLNVELEHIECVGCEELIIQAIENLLTNAVKFSTDGGSLGISSSLDGEFALISVQDSGIGMTPEVQERIFDKFYRANSGQASRGNGLGLAIAKQVVELHGGEITVESQPGKGSKFTIRLPDCVRAVNYRTQPKRQHNNSAV
jgi:signal transduction histidine kinase